MARTKTCLLILLTTVSLLSRSQAADGDILVADFEGGNWGDWKVTGEAFGAGPAAGTLPNQMAVDGFLGKGLVNSFHGGDDTIGMLDSPTFKIERRYLRFLIGGGMHPGKTCMNLLLNGEVVRTATGPNDRSGGSEHLDWQQWDVGEFTGKTAAIQIVDQATGGWGHINIDHIVQTDAPLPRWMAEVSREMAVEKDYLLLPIKNGTPRRLMSFLVDGRLERQFEIELADEEPDWWAFMDLKPFRDKTAVLKVDKLREDSKGLAAIHQGDQIKGKEPLYQERLRPRFHFTSRRGWNNDPNGLVFYKGEYHLFYQHNPYGWDWGNMHWGHAISQDLVHWKELDEALYPDELGTMFSGSAVVDWNNTAGFQKGREKALVSFYTAAGGTSPWSKGRPFTQALAYSLDRGRTWTKYDNNPILPHIVGGNRDPKVFWHTPQKKWIMALYLDGTDFGLFSSPDLKQWEKLSQVSIPDCTECPEFFEIPVNGSKTETRWVFYGGNGRYLVGGFDGKTFTSESGPHALNFGNCFYASQTYNDIPERDGRRILVPWGQMATPGMPFNQMMGIPVELTLRRTEEGLRLFVNPIRELEKLRAKCFGFKSETLHADRNPFSAVNGELLDIEVDLSPGGAEELTFLLRGVLVVYDVIHHELRCQDRKAVLKPIDGKIRLRFLVDRTSIDIFGNNGQLYMPMGVIVPSHNFSVVLSMKGQGARIDSAKAFVLKSAWR